MIIDGVDPRDSEWDVERPTYRVDGRLGLIRLAGLDPTAQGTLRA